MPEKGTVLGLDLGPNSVGWALIDAEFENGAQIAESGLLAAGVRVFEEGVDNFDTSKEASRAAARRATRSARRRQRRLLERRQRLRAALQQAGLLPTDEAALREVFALDPYPLRAKALDEALTLPELGRVIHNLVRSRKGSRPLRRSSTKPELGLWGSFSTNWGN
jgi:CRISPR-associated endonuclease Csn1